jgi:hypothetical protein
VRLGKESRDRSFYSFLSYGEENELGASQDGMEAMVEKLMGI